MVDEIKADGLRTFLKRKVLIHTLTSEKLKCFTHFLVSKRLIKLKKLNCFDFFQKLQLCSEVSCFQRKAQEIIASIFVI